VRDHKAASALAGPARTAALLRDPVPLDVGGAVTSSAASSQRSGLVLLLSALGLLVLVLAGGSTLRGLMRMEPKFR
jgi:hypothetical protein